jgi:uracil-DNA glycosylase
MTFQDFLVKWYGRRIKELTRLKNDGLHFIPENMHQNYAPNHDKCQDCAAKIFRQDIPFWLGSHKNKKLMVIAQDAGKGVEDYGLNTVFSIHSAFIDKEAYFNASSRHKGYYNLFRGMIDSEEFLEEIYFTDIIKCAYSTMSTIQVDETKCKNFIFQEINEVNPKSILLMGKPAQITFHYLIQQQRLKLEQVKSISCSINAKSAISFSHFHFQDKHVFFSPHVIGNLHISKEYKNQFDEFKTEIVNYICEKIR